MTPWIRAAVLLGVLYAAIGIVFALPATHAKAWRLAAWGVSGVAFIAHIASERFRLRCSPRRAALHVAAGAALGAFGLAVGAYIHALAVASSSEHQRRLLLAFLIWPVITGIPAFLVALGLGVLLGPRDAQVPR